MAPKTQVRPWGSDKAFEHPPLDVGQVTSDRSDGATLVAAGHGGGDGAVGIRGRADDLVDLSPVDLGVEQGRELAAAEQGRQRLGVDLGQDRVAAGRGDGGVERPVDGPELIERGRHVGGQLDQLLPSGVVRPLTAKAAIAGSMTRRTSNSWRTIVLRSSGVRSSAGSLSATIGRLPRRTR